MKKYYFAAVAALALFMSSCEPREPQTPTSTTVDFEDVTLTEGKHYTESFILSNLEFNNSYNEQYDSWEGCGVSSLVDTETAGFGNGMSVIAGAAYEGSKFGVIYSGTIKPTITSKLGGKRFESLMICNSTYPYISMRDGDDYAKKFEDGDWFMVTIKGMTADSIETGSTDFYLADFRDGKTTLVNSWEKVDLTPLGECCIITFNFTSSDNGEWGINTPTYACIDNIVYASGEEIPE